MRKIIGILSIFSVCLFGTPNLHAQDGASGTVVIAVGQVSSITLENPGIGYIQVPDIVITGDGSSATAVANLAPDGSIESVTITNGGSGYSSASVSFEFGGTEAILDPILVASVDPVNSGGPEGMINLNTSCTNRASMPTPVFSNWGSGAGTGATGTVYGELSNNSLITNGGSGYVGKWRDGDMFAPVLIFSPPDDPTPPSWANPAEGFARVLGPVTSISILDPDPIYWTSPPPTSLQPSKGAVLSSVLSTTNGRVNDINLLTPGSGYSFAPTVDVGGSAIASVGDMSVDAVTLTDPGDQYLFSDGIPVIFQTGTAAAVANLATSISSAWTGFPASSLTTGYSIGSPPVWIASGGGATTDAIITGVVSGSSLIGFTVTNPGANYISDPTWTLDSGTDPNTIAGTLRGGFAIQSITVVDPGFGYFSAPTVTIDPPWTSQADAGINGLGAAPVTALAGATLQINFIQVNLQGAGYDYTNPPLVTISGGGGVVQATAEAIIEAPVESVSILSGGLFYNDDFFNLQLDWWSPNDIEVHVTGSVTELILWDQGSGYSNTPTITVDNTDGGSGATISALLEDCSAYLRVTNPGAGYIVNPDGTLEVQVTFATAGWEDLIPYFAGHDFEFMDAFLQLEVTNGGSGYTADPNVLVSEDGGTNWYHRGTTTINSGSVTSATVIDQPQGGYMVHPMVVVSIHLDSDFTPPPPNNEPGAGVATADINSGSIVTIPISDGGFGYSEPPTVIILGNGSGATAVANLAPDGSIESVTITNGGSGYTAASVSFEFGGTEAILDPILVASVDPVNSGGPEGMINLNTSCTNRASMPTPVFSNWGSGAGTGATGTVYGELSNNSLITNGGSGYVGKWRDGDMFAPVLIFSPPDDPTPPSWANPAEGFARVLGPVTSISILDPDPIYWTSPPPTSLQPSKGAVLSSVLSTTNGRVNDINLLTPGSGYSFAPTVDVGGSAIASVGDMSVDAVTLTDPGDQYLFSDGIPVIFQTGTAAAVANLATSISSAWTGFPASSLTTGYSIGSPPVWIASGGGATTDAIITGVVSGSSLIGFTVTNPGANYISDPTWTLDSGTDPNTIAGTLRGGFAIQSITVVDPGFGYFSAPTVTIDPPWTSQADAGINGLGAAPVTALAGATLQINFIQVNLQGAGYDYTNPPLVTISGGGGVVQATAEAIIEAPVESVSILSGGLFYNDDFFNLQLDWWSPNDIEVHVTGSVTELILWDQGSGYSNTPTITVDNTDGGSGATISALLEDCSAYLRVTNPGAGYIVNPDGTLEVQVTFATAGWEDLIPYFAGHDFEFMDAFLQLEVTNGGSGYTADPNVLVSEDGGTNWYHRGTTTINSGSVTSATVVDQPQGGYMVHPMVKVVNHLDPSFTPPPPVVEAGTGTGTAIISSGVITSITVDNGGVEYSQPPDVVIIGNGSGATAVANLAPDGSIESVTITNGGSGYTAASVSFEFGGTEAILDPILVASVDPVNSGGPEGMINLNTSCTNRASMPTPVFSNWGSGAGTGATGTVYGELSNNSLITNGGSGYVGKWRDGDMFAPVLIFSPPDDPTPPSWANPAEGFARVLGPVTSISILDPDPIYWTSPPPTSLQPSKGAVLSSVLSTTNGRVNDINLLTPGSGYSFAPTVDVGGSAIASVGDMSVDAVTLTDPGDQYLFSDGIPVIFQTGTAAAVANLATSISSAWTGFPASSLTTGYSIGSPPVWIASGGGATTDAIITGVVSGSSLIGFTVTNPGANYISDPTWTLDSGTDPNTIAGTLRGGFAIQSITVVDPGFGYFSAPTVTIDPPWTSQADAGINGLGAAPVTALAGATLQINFIQVNLQGAGYDYTNPPLVTISGGGGVVQATAEAIIEAPVESVSILSGGLFYNDDFFNLQLDWWSPNDIEVHVTGSVTELILWDQGSGYSNTPTITVDNTDGGSGATISALLEDCSAYLRVTNPGAGYIVNPDGTLEVQVTFATAGWEDLIPYFAGHDFEFMDAFLQLEVTNGGSGYTADPWAPISEDGGTTWFYDRATATASGGSVISANVISDPVGGYGSLPMAQVVIHKEGLSATDILTFTVPQEASSATIDPGTHTVALDVVPGTDPGSLMPTFTLSFGGSALVGLVSQESGITVNDFSSPTIYTVHGQDWVTEQDWTVTVNVLPYSETDILTYSLAEQTGPAVINATNHTVDIEVAFGTNRTNLVSTFTLSPLAGAKVSSTDQVSGATPNDFTNPVTYIITAEDGITIQNWTITVTEAPPPSAETDFLTFSFAEETGPATINSGTHQVQVEVAFGTDVTSLASTFTLSDGATAKVGATDQISATTSNDFTNPVIYDVTAEDGVTDQPWTVTVTVSTAVSAETGILTYSFNEQTGSATIDATGNTISMEVNPGTDLTNLVATFTLSTGASAVVGTTPQISLTTANDFTNPVTYTVTALDGVTTQDWVVTVTVAPRTEIDIISFSFSEQTGQAIINESNHSIQVEVQLGTDMNSLIASFTLSPGASANIGTTIQISGITINAFTSIVIFTVTAEDGTTIQDWEVIVTEQPNNGTDFLTFILPEETGIAVINTTDHTIQLEVPFGTNVSALVAGFTLSESASVKVGTTAQINDNTANDFTNPLVYTVTAEDGTTTQDWTITVVIAPNIETDILTFSLSEQTGAATIDATNHTISVEVAINSAIANLIPTFTLSEGATANVGATSQVSGTTANDFTASVTYRITAEDGTTVQDWIVSVTEEPDTVDPGLTFATQPPEELMSGTTSLEVQVQATDNKAVSSVKLFHAGILNSGSFQSIDAVDQGNNIWSATVTEAMFDVIGLIFYFEAQDAAGNSDQTEEKLIHRIFDASSSPSIPSNFLGAGGNNGQWKMFSIPYDLDDNTIATLFESDLGTYDKTKWRLIRWNQSTNGFIEYKSGISTIDLGKGYWFNSVEQAQIQLGAGSASQVNPNQLRTIPLDNGWTQVGNPYPFNILWSDVLSHNGDPDVQNLIVFDGTTLGQGSSLPAFGGAYVFGDGTDLEVPLDAATSSPARVKGNSNPLDSDDWEVDLIVETDGFRNTLGRVGMNVQAEYSKDAYDIMRPPRFMEYIDLTFNHEDYHYPWFSGDIVPSQDSYSWDFEVSRDQGAGVAVLSWDNSYYGLNEYSLLLEDLQSGQFIDLRTDDQYVFNIDNSRKFRLHYGIMDDLIAQSISGPSLNAPYPNPFNTSTEISYVLPESDSGYDIEVFIYNATGQVVKSIKQHKVSPGLHSFEWDGLSGTGVYTGAGIYMVKMYVNGESSSELTKRLVKK